MSLDQLIFNLAFIQEALAVTTAENPDPRSKEGDYPSYYNFKTLKPPKEFFFLLMTSVLYFVYQL